MIRSEFMSALKQVATERGISAEEVIDTLKRAMVAAYRKDYPGEIQTSTDEEGNIIEEEIDVKIDKKTGEVSLHKDGEDVTPPGFGRIAAQTAKQVILQGVREAEKTAVIEEFRDKLEKVMPGMIQRLEKGNWLIDIGRTTAIIPREEQIYNEDYHHGKRIKVFIKEIREGENFSEIIASRTEPGLVKALFELEVPEVQNGAVEIKNIAREVGSRTKVAVASTQEGVDPVGSMVGQRGVRVQAVTDELNGEKMDIILWSESPETFIINSLAPAQVIDVIINNKDMTAQVEVVNDQLSLAIGKEGQNVRLASKLTGYKIDIVGEGGEKPMMGKKRETKNDNLDVDESTDTVKKGTLKETNELQEAGLSNRTINTLAKTGIETLEQLKLLTPEQLEETPGIGPKAKEEIAKAIED